MFIFSFSNNLAFVAGNQVPIELEINNEIKNITALLSMQCDNRNTFDQLGDFGEWNAHNGRRVNSEEERKRQNGFKIRTKIVVSQGKQIVCLLIHDSPSSALPLDY